jgi:hypothetical protein
MDALLQAALTEPVEQKEKEPSFAGLDSDVPTDTDDTLSKDQRKRRKKKEADHRLQLALSTMHTRLHRAQERQEQLEKINWQLFLDNQALRQNDPYAPCQQVGDDAGHRAPQALQHNNGAALVANTGSQDSSWTYDPLLDLSSQCGFVDL